MPFNFDDFANIVGITPTVRPPAEPTEPDPTTDTQTTAKRVRPDDIRDMVGQERARVQLMNFLRSAQIRDEQPGHFLFFGPPGLGKTTMAKVVAGTLNAHLLEHEATSVNTPFKMAQELGKLTPGDVFFVDEIHALSQPTQELLGKAMEDGYITISTGTGKTTTSTRINLPPFTLVGATTLAGNLTGPMRARFTYAGALEYYEDDELARIITRAAEKLATKIEPDAALELGSRSRGTPRTALNLLGKARDYAVTSTGDREAVVTANVVEEALSLYDIDYLGLDPQDRHLLLSLCKDHMGGPVGIDNLAASSGIEKRTAREVIEPFLIRQGLMRRTTRGRLATKAAFKRFGLKPPITLDLYGAE